MQAKEPKYLLSEKTLLVDNRGHRKVKSKEYWRRAWASAIVMVCNSFIGKIIIVSLDKISRFSFYINQCNRHYEIKKHFTCHSPLYYWFIIRTIACSRLANLFNGKDLSGWKRLAGTADYKVEDGVIVGRTVVNSRNTFLVTEKEYGDFILEADVWVEDEEGNAGLQTRSHFDPAAFNGEGRVYGRQCEIDPTSRRWTGGIYDEGRREWLYPMQLNAAAQNVYKPGVYNHYK